MSELSSICEYCLRPSDGVQSCCAHCGAPLRAIASRLESGVHASAELAREAEKSAMRMGGVAAAVGAAGVATASRALASRGRTMLGQLLAVVIGLAAILVAVVVVLRSCAAAVPIGGLGTPFESLPATLRFAADCRSVDGEQSAQRCVIPADSMLLSGSVSGGRDLMLTVDIVPAEQGVVRTDPLAFDRDVGADGW